MIEFGLVRDIIWDSEVVMPHYTPKGWWENDVFRVTKNRLWVEYEIKTSVGDFRADAKKSNRSGNKHELLAADNESGPSRFYFVLPESLSINVPEWAGLIKFRQRPNDAIFMTSKVAPLRHNRKVDDDVVHGIWRTAYWRLITKNRTSMFQEAFEAGEGI